MAVIIEVAGVLRDAVRQLVGDDIEGAGKADEDDAVAVAEDHLGAVPEGVVVVLTVVNVALQFHAVVVDGIAMEDLLIKVPGRPEVVVRLVDGLVGGRRAALGAGDLAGRRPGMASIVDGTAFLRSAARGQLAENAPALKLARSDEQGPPSTAADALVLVLEQGVQDVGRNDAVQRVARLTHDADSLS